jgi:hypothetical protein
MPRLSSKSGEFSVPPCSYVTLRSDRRFPDRICLEAYFHPQDTVEEIRLWLSDSCFLHSEHPPHSSFSFDLYITPPRLVLPLDVPLQELKLVPAAVLYLSWKITPELPTRSEDPLPGRGYLNFHLYRTANSLCESPEVKGEAESLANESSVGDPLLFPRGQRLVKGEGGREEAGRSGDLDGDAESMSKDRKPSAAAGTKKPRWLKT